MIRKFDIVLLSDTCQIKSDIYLAFFKTNQFVALKQNQDAMVLLSTSSKLKLNFEC